MSREVLRIERLGSATLKLVRADRKYRLVEDSGSGGLHFMALTPRISFRTEEVALQAFDFAVTMERAWEAMMQGRPAGELLAAMEQSANQLRDAEERHGDFPEWPERPSGVDE